MGNFAPTYMTDYDKDGTDLVAGNLGLSAATFAAAAAQGTAIGNVTGRADARSIISLVSPLGKVQLVGLALQVGIGNVAGALPVTLREDSQYAQGTPKLTTINVTVT